MGNTEKTEETVTTSKVSEAKAEKETTKAATSESKKKEAEVKEETSKKVEPVKEVKKTEEKKPVEKQIDNANAADAKKPEEKKSDTKSDAKMQETKHEEPETKKDAAPSVEPTTCSTEKNRLVQVRKIVVYPIPKETPTPRFVSGNVNIIGQVSGFTVIEYMKPGFGIVKGYTKSIQ